VALPLIAPLEFIVRPAGNAPPVTVQVYGAVPPDTARVAEYATPTDPLGKVGGVVMERLEVTLSENVLVVETDALSVT
jgi:hypothetical protein